MFEHVDIDRVQKVASIAKTASAISKTAKEGTAKEGTEKIAVFAVGINANFSQGRSAPDKNNAVLGQFCWNLNEK